MKLLLDTHILIWALASPDRLPSLARRLIETAENEVFYSAACPWEVQIKHASSPERMPMQASELVRWCEQTGFAELPFEARHVLALDTLARDEQAPVHKDPFDRIMLAQAKTDGLFLLTHDQKLEGYDESCVLLV